jgi:hypothetical protein
MRVIIAGSRAINNYAKVCDAVRRSDFPISRVLSGMAAGVDNLALRYATENALPIDSFPARWDDLDAPGAIIRRRRDGRLYNARAGYDRNERMAAVADALVAIWDAKSPGTKHMIDIATRRGLRVYVYRVGYMPPG